MLTFLSDTWTGVLTAFRGAPTTLYVSFAAVIGGLILGFVLAFMRRSRAKVLRGVSTLYIDIVRGTPLLVQVLIVAYGIPALVNNNGGDFKWAQDVIPAMLCCGLNSAAYMGGDRAFRSECSGEGAAGSSGFPGNDPWPGHAADRDSPGPAHYSAAAGQ